MSSSGHNELLDRAASAGVLSEYVDVDGNTVDAQGDALEAVLSALQQTHLEPLPIEPVVVAWDGRLDMIARRDDQQSTASFSLQTEDGAIIEGEATGSGRNWHVGIELPLGYHRLRLGGSQAEPTLVIAAPRRAHPSPHDQWGVFAPVYALRRDGDRGIGDLSHLGDLVDIAASEGAGLVSTLPLLPMFLEPGKNPSPYSPVSLLFWNELFLDPAAAPFASGTQAFRPAGGPARTIDYELAFQQTRTLVDRLLSDRRIDAWAERHPHVRNYCEFRAYGEANGRDWRAWKAEARGGIVAANSADPGRVRWHLAAQWAIDLQLRAVANAARDQGVMVGLDYPVGVHLDGYDIWANQDLFVDDVTIGAPPDTFFAGGQDWELVPIHPEISRRSGHHYLIEGLRHQIALGGLLRIDHIMGLFRRWWIPGGGAATEGAYVTYPADELLAIICLESIRASCVVVGENLGTVPSGVNEALLGHGILGMFIAQDHLDEAGRLTTSPPENSMALINTHDMATFAQTWGDRPHPIAALDAVTKALRSGPAELVVTTMEDRWLELGRQNVPGTTTGNWQQRFRPSMAEIADSSSPISVKT